MINKPYFNSIIETIAVSDAVIWTFPVYYLMIPSQLKRFIELVYERECTYAFRDKYSTAISTSANFFDHTAHNYPCQVQISNSYLKQR